MLVFPAGHGAVDWGGGALWLLAPAIATSMGLNPFQVGILFAARQIGAGIAQLPAGFIGDNLKKRGIFLLATFWWVSATQLMASGSGNYWAVVGFLTLASAGAAAWHPVAMGAMTQWMPDRKAFVLGMHMMGGTVAEIATPLLVGILLTFLSWNQVLQINTIPTIILGLIFIRLAPMVIAPPSEFGAGLNIKGLARSIVQPGTLSILLAIVLHNMSIVAFMSMAPLYFQEVKGFSSGLTGLGVSLFLIGGAVTTPFAGHISDKGPFHHYCYGLRKDRPSGIHGTRINFISGRGFRGVRSSVSWNNSRYGFEVCIDIGCYFVFTCWIYHIPTESKWTILTYLLNPDFLIGNKGGHISSLLLFA